MQLAGSDKQLDGGWSVTLPAVAAMSEGVSAQRCPWELHLSSSPGILIRLPLQWFD